MKKNLSTILASSLALSLLSPCLQVANAQEITAVDSILATETQEMHSDTLATSYQAGYFEYKEIIAPQYDDGNSFAVEDRLAAVKVDGKWGYINEFNQMVISPNYDYAGTFNEGSAIVGTKNSSGGYTVGILDIYGKYTSVLMGDTIAALVVSSFPTGVQFHNGFCTSLNYTKDGVYYGVILDKIGNGTPVEGFKLNPYNEGIITANSNKGTSAVVLDIYGNIIRELGSYTVDSMNKGIIPAYNTSNRVGFYSYHSNSWLIDPQYKDYSWFDILGTCTAFGETGLVVVQNTSGKYGAVDMNNNVVVPFNYQFMYNSSEGLMMYKLSGKEGYLDTTGNVAIPAIYTNVTSFSGGTAAVKTGSSTYLIDQKGNKIAGSELLDSSSYFTSEYRFPPKELVTISQGGKTGYGQVLFNPELPVEGDTSDWALDKVIAAIQAELVPADQQNMYKNNVTREDFAFLALISMAARANLSVDDYVIEKTGKSMLTLLNNYPFNDTNNRYVVAAEAVGIVSGRSEHTYDPYANITRQEVATILTAMSRVTGDDVGNPPAANVVDRDSIASWALPSVDYVIHANIMGTMGENDFGPMGNCTREQTFTIMYNYYSSL